MKVGWRWQSSYGIPVRTPKAVKELKGNAKVDLWQNTAL